MTSDNKKNTFFVSSVGWHKKSGSVHFFPWVDIVRAENADQADNISFAEHGFPTYGTYLDYDTAYRNAEYAWQKHFDNHPDLSDIDSIL